MNWVGRGKKIVFFCSMYTLGLRFKSRSPPIEPYVIVSHHTAPLSPRPLYEEAEGSIEASSFPGRLFTNHIFHIYERIKKNLFFYLAEESQDYIPRR